MKMPKKLTTIILVSAVLAACQPGMYTGVGWTDSAGPADPRASLGFNVECWEAEAPGTST